MWPGKRQKVVFEFTGPSYQAILDKLHTAKILSIHNGVYTIEADVYGDGIKMYLLSQGSWVKVISPQSFVEEMKDEIRKMNNLYEKGGEENG
ncbi:WCX domain-containing protein [Longibaculum muris]